MSKDPICKDCKGKGKLIDTLENAKPWSHPRYDPDDVVYKDCTKCGGRIRKAEKPIEDK